MRPARLTSRASLEPESSRPQLERARELVLAYGWNSTSYQTLNPGIQLWFSAGRQAVVGYVEQAGALVVAGAPVCAEEDVLAVTAELEDVARRRGLRVCYFGAESRLEAAYHGSPLHSTVLLGAQPAWAPAAWPGILEGHASLRAQLHRARNKGVRVEAWSTERAHHPEIENCLGEWLASRGLPPLHFLVEPQTLDRLTDRWIFVARQGRDLVGFLVASPVPRRQGWLVEQIIRGATAPNGTAELMLDAAFQRMRREGSGYVTLGLAPLSRRATLSATENPLWLRLVLRAVRSLGRGFYNFEGLDSFKAKFQPERWEPVFAIAAEPHFSPHTLWAIAAAFSGGSPLRLAALAVRRRLLGSR